jgi:hypothetical protein
MIFKIYFSGVTSPQRYANLRGTSNSSYDAGSYDSYEPLKHSTPLHSNKYQQWKTPPSPVDPTRYGYPADFGLPIPTSVVVTAAHPAAAASSSSAGSPSLAHLLNYSADGGSVASSSVALPPLADDQDSTSVTVTTRATPSKSLRVKQQGVCVLPPLPSIIKAAKNPESPDEGYQEDGTEV